jgi:lipopolysaccharide transport system ATP-binding protein
MSSDDFAIRVTGVSKHFELYDHPRDQLKQFVFPRIQRMMKWEQRQYFREFKALDGISIEVKKGETVGVIGRNGSGKSTLLQILCGTLTPSSGIVETNGRVAALLELGAGFNPEFTGRENVYMNAGVLGLRKEEIDSRFDEIIAFADIGDFINQPVKIYSSGMYVRLAFAVIAHVNASILIIDEALSVGDALFTQKCMRYLRNFMKNGTVLFVSHDASAVKNLCTRTLWLDKGHLVKEGVPSEVCDLYLQNTLQEMYGNEIKLSSLSNSGSGDQANNCMEKAIAVDYGVVASIQDNMIQATGWKTGVAEITSVSFEKVDDSDLSVFKGGEKVCVTIKAKAYGELSNPILGFIVKDRLGQELFGENTIPVTIEKQCSVMARQEMVAQFIFRLPMLQNGQYAVMASLANGDSYNHVHHHYLHDALIINVHSSQIRFGIVGVLFESVELDVINPSKLY